MRFSSRFVFIVTALLISTAHGSTTLEQALLAKVKPIMDAAAASYNVSFSVAVKHAQADFALASGLSDHASKTPATNKSMYPAG